MKSKVKGAFFVFLDKSEYSLSPGEILEGKRVSMGKKAKIVLKEFSGCDNTPKEEDNWQMEMYHVEDDFPP